MENCKALKIPKSWKFQNSKNTKFSKNSEVLKIPKFQNPIKFPNSKNFQILKITKFQNSIFKYKNSEMINILNEIMIVKLFFRCITIRKMFPEFFYENFRRYFEKIVLPI